MVGMRAAARGAVRHEQSETNIRACLDLVEQLVRVSREREGAAKWRPP